MPTVNIAQLSHQWHNAPRRWGHPMHSLCSYFAMFPPQVPHVLIRWLTQPDDVVYDPFAGRGTVPMEACRLGRFGLGSDANPLAYVLTAAKVDPPPPARVYKRIAELRRSCRRAPTTDAPSNIQMLYHRRVLRQLLRLRETLDETERTDRFLLAALLGLMHANYDPGRPARGLSISMPNTFSMSPGYVRRYIRQNRLVPPDVDVLDLLESKITRMALPDSHATRGRAWQSDARNRVRKWAREHPAKLVLTSPPYLSVIKYGKYNWVRLWMLKQDPREVDNTLVATSSLAKYLDFMTLVLGQLHEAVRDDGYLCLIVGDVRDPVTDGITNLAEHVWSDAASKCGWHRVAVINDRLPAQHKVSRIWKHKRGHATKTDRILVLTRQAVRRTSLPAPKAVDWHQPITWA